MLLVEKFSRDVGGHLLSYICLSIGNSLVVSAAINKGVIDDPLY